MNAFLLLESAFHMQNNHLLSIGISIISLYLFFTSQSWKLRHIPTAGFSSWSLLSFISTAQFIWRGNDLIQEYHERYRGKPFKIAHLTGWFVILNNGSEDVKEASRWPESVAQLYPVLKELFQVEIAVGPIAAKEHHLIAMIKRLTRNISHVTSEIRDEYRSAIEDIITPTNEWKSFKVDAICMPIVSRVVARTIVGKDLCSNKEFLDICLEFPKQVFKTAVLATVLFPSFLKPLFPYVFNGPTPIINSTAKLIEPIINRSHLSRKNSKQMQSNTSLDWIIDMAEDNEDESQLDVMATRILEMVIGALHTSSITFQRVLYNLCQNPEYIALLREEGDQAVSQYGWSKDALDHMKKLESFIQESLRLMPVSTLLSLRMIMADHILHDGTFLPAGTMVTFYTDAVHMDHTIYPEPDKFDGLRFFNMNLQASKNNLTTPNRNNITFGIGKQACPGRFIASMEIKLMISYLILNYDVKVGHEETRVPGILPKYEILGGNPRVPRDYGNVLIRKRQTNTDDEKYI